MKMTDEDTELEQFFAAARAETPALPKALEARILEDAAMQMPRSRTARGFGMLWELLGGAIGAGGLVTATAVGVWLGLAPPAALPDLAGQFVSGSFAETEDEMSETEALLAPAAFGWDQEEI